MFQVESYDRTAPSASRAGVRGIAGRPIDEDLFAALDTHQLPLIDLDV
jgi:hypothetical protein